MVSIFLFSTPAGKIKNTYLKITPVINFYRDVPFSKINLKNTIYDKRITLPPHQFRKVYSLRIFIGFDFLIEKALRTVKK